jgi:hypothetical protein
MKVIADDPGLTLAVLPYPLSLPVQTELIQLLRTQWTRTDYDWLEAMHGDYSERLVITSVLARRDGQAIATATVHFARGRPEVAVLGGVLTADTDWPGRSSRRRWPLPGRPAVGFVCSAPAGSR